MYTLTLSILFHWHFQRHAFQKRVFTNLPSVLSQSISSLFANSAGVIFTNVSALTFSCKTLARSVGFADLSSEHQTPRVYAVFFPRSLHPSNKALSMPTAISLGFSAFSAAFAVTPIASSSFFATANSLPASSSRFLFLLNLSFLLSIRWFFCLFPASFLLPFSSTASRSSSPLPTSPAFCSRLKAGHLVVQYRLLDVDVFLFPEPPPLSDGYHTSPAECPRPTRAPPCRTTPVSVHMTHIHFPVFVMYTRARHQNHMERRESPSQTQSHVKFEDEEVSGFVLFTQKIFILQKENNDDARRRRRRRRRTSRRWHRSTSQRRDDVVHGQKTSLLLLLLLLGHMTIR